MKREYYEKWMDKGSPNTQDRVREKLARIIETHQPVVLGDHEKSELENIRAEGEEVLKNAAR